MEKRHYTKRTEKEYRLTAAKCYSIAEMCIEFGLLPRGGNYGTIKGNIKKYNIDISHFTGQAWNKDNFSLTPQNTKAIKLKLIRDRGHQCEKCKLTEWFEIPITLELEHVDGNRTNNKDENLKLFCPNCHSQTPTWKRAKSSFADKKPNPNSICPTCKGNKYPRSKECRECSLSTICECGNHFYRTSKNCPDCLKQNILYKTPTNRGKNSNKLFKQCQCGKTIRSVSKTCVDCYVKRTKIEWPEINDLINMVKESSFLQVGKKLGVSDNAVRKHLARNSINMKEL